MPDLFYQALLWLAYLCGGLIALAIAYEFFHWAIGALWTLTLQLIEGTSRLLIHSTITVCLVLKKTLLSLLVMVSEILKTVALLIVVPAASWCAESITACRDYMALVRLYLKHGRKDFGSFSDFKRHMLGDEEEERAQKSEYEEALEILGFSTNAAFTPLELKKRYREILSIVHPDKGFPNGVFAQQINDAVMTIKRERKWS